MAVRLKHIKNITSPNVITTYQLILNSLFGDNLPAEYDKNKRYNKGDVIITMLPNGGYRLKIAKEDNIKGTFDNTKWNDVYFTNLFRSGSALDMDFSKAIQISVDQPRDKDNMEWYQPVSVKEGDGSLLEIGDSKTRNIIIYKNEHFAAQVNKPDGPEVRLWLEYEE